MNIEDRVPKSLVGAPGDALDAARHLLEVLAALTTADSELKIENNYGMGVFRIVQLAQDLIEYEQTHHGRSTHG